MNNNGHFNAVVFLLQFAPWSVDIVPEVQGAVTIDSAA